MSHILEIIESIGHGHSDCMSTCEIGYCRVRAVHNIANGPKVNVVVDGKTALPNVCYKQISNYMTVPCGEHCVGIATDDGCQQFIASKTFDLVAGNDYTIIAHGLITDPASIDLLGLEDNNAVPAYIRFVHAAAGAPAVDVYETTNSDNPKELFRNVSYGQTGNPEYLTVDAGVVNIAITPNRSDEIVLGPISLCLQQGKIYTIIASGVVGDCNTPLTALISCDNIPKDHQIMYRKADMAMMQHKAGGTFKDAATSGK